MKKVAAVLAAVVLVVCLVSVVFAAEAQKGTIKGVDTKAGTITFCPEGTTTDMTLKADKSVDLSHVKENMKAEIMVDNDMVTGIKEMKRRISVGC